MKSVFCTRVSLHKLYARAIHMLVLLNILGLMSSLLVIGNAQSAPVQMGL